MPNSIPIRDTWTNESLVADARKRLQETMQEKMKIKKRHEFEFVIDDRNIYHYAADFRSPQAKAQFRNYLQLKESYNQQQNKLENMRTQYSRANQNEKKQKWLQLYSIWKNECYSWQTK